MPAPIPAELVDVLERLGADSNGDVQSIIDRARAQAPGPFADDALLAQAIEAAGIRRAQGGDRTAGWWLACALAVLRASAIASAQEDAEVNAARFVGELWQSSAASGPLPPRAQWVVAGSAEPPPTATTIELARRNALTHLEVLGAELLAKSPVIRGRIDASRGEPSARKAIEDAIATYDIAAIEARMALSRAIDHVVARARDASLAAAGAAALAEVDELAIPSVHARTLEARQLLGAYGQPVGLSTFLDRSGERPSFVGAAPPSFRQGGVSPSATPIPTSLPTSIPTSIPTSMPSSTPSHAPLSREALEQAMRVAFERAWTTPSPEARQAFIHAVRARYEVETATIADPEARQRALEHYVAHSLAQLPPR